MDALRLFRHPLPMSREQADSMVTVEEMWTMLAQKRELFAKILFPQPEIMESGLINTSRGAVLTSDHAMTLLRVE